MDEIYRQNEKIVFHFLFQRCGDRQLAEDLTQETFLKAFESIDRFQGTCRISTWLCQIAKHLLYQYWQKHGTKGMLELDEELPAEDDTADCAEKRLELLDVLKELQKLPEQMREVVYLRTLSDLSYREIGEILGKSENWARVTFFRAKETLLKAQNLEGKGKRHGQNEL